MMSPAVAAIGLQLIVLHQIDGRQVLLNPEHVTSLFSKLPGTPNRWVAPGSHCVVMLVDGKHVGVAETCAAVRKLIEGK